MEVDIHRFAVPLDGTDAAMRDAPLQHLAN
jgi:hypothetical protein